LEDVSTGVTAIENGVVKVETGFKPIVVAPSDSNVGDQVYIEWIEPFLWEAAQIALHLLCSTRDCGWDSNLSGKELPVKLMILLDRWRKTKPIKRSKRRLTVTKSIEYLKMMILHQPVHLTTMVLPKVSVTKEAPPICEFTLIMGL
jgi:hypothetical protein